MLKWFRVFGGIIFLLPTLVFAQGGNWVWMNGPDTLNGTAIYGVKGQPAPGNTPPGLYEACRWIDKQGNFWIYGGVGYPEVTKTDLWKFDPITNQWTWVWSPPLGNVVPVYGYLGLPSPSNSPGARGWATPTWADTAGNLWLYGGTATFANSGYLGTDYADMWEYNISTNEWAWMSGTNSLNQQPAYGAAGVASISYTPGMRAECASNWVDAQGNFWLFGGQGPADNGYNDIWKYDISINEWAYYNGSHSAGSSGYYGPKGRDSSIYQPPGMVSHSSWKDKNGNFYIFGGSPSPGLNYDDVWRYNPVANTWAWVAGDGRLDGGGPYRGYCSAQGDVGAYSRYENRSPLMNGCVSNNCFNFGGFASNTNSLNDLWMFNTQNLQWTWLSGPPTQNDSGSYGIKGAVAAGNLPSARGGHCLWFDAGGNLWMFGGMSMRGKFSDVWKFIPDASCVPVELSSISASLTKQVICHGDSSVLAITGATGIRVMLGNMLVSGNAVTTLRPDTTTTYIVYANTACKNNDTAHITLQVVNSGKINYTNSTTQLCQSETDTLTVVDQSHVTITPGTGVSMADSSHYLLQPTQTTTYTVHGVSTLCGGNDSAKITITVNQHNPVKITLSDTAGCADETITVTTSGLQDVFITNVTGFNWLNDTAFTLQGQYNLVQYPVVSGLTSCGGRYTDTLTVRWLALSGLNYSLSSADICPGGTMVLTLYRTDSISITPSASVTWLDSLHILLRPAVSTTYTVSGRGQCTGRSVSNIPVHVLTPGVVNYNITQAGICSGGGNISIYTYGLTNLHVSPQPGAVFYPTDSLDAEIYFQQLTSAATVTITGTDICGNADSTSIFIPVIASEYLNQSKPDICRGDSLTVSMQGINDFAISPATGFRYADSSVTQADLYFYPDTTTLYTITGKDCYGNFNSTVKVNVYAPGNFGYSVLPPVTCVGQYTDIQVNGVTALQTTPTINFAWNNPTTAQASFFATHTQTYQLNVTDVCGQHDSTYFTIIADSVFALKFGKLSLCRGDSSTLHIVGAIGAHITPSTGLRWIDSANVVFKPDSTTRYVLTASKCYGLVDTPFTVYVFAPGQFTYSVNQVPVCANGGFDTIYISGLSNVNISPSFVSPVPAPDSTDWTVVTYNTGNTPVFTITGTQVCGGRDTATVAMPTYPPGTVTANKTLLCQGDSALVTFTGVKNCTVYPTDSATWLDSTHVLLYPATTTTYYFGGQLYCPVNGYYTFSSNITISAGHSGQLAYTPATESICSGYNYSISVYSQSTPIAVPPLTFTLAGSQHYVGTVTPAQSETFTISATDLCGGNDTVQSAVYIYPAPSYTLSTNSICAGDSVLVTMHNFTTFPFISPTVAINWTSDTTAWIKPQGNDSYTITANNYCGAAVEFGTSVSVVTPLLNVASSGNTICPGDTANLCATAGYPSYQWSNGQTTDCIKALTGTYTTTVTDVHGCTASSYPVTVTEYPAPPSISITATDTLICSYDSTQICATPGFNLYEWIIDNFVVATTSCIKVAPGTYIVRGTDNHGCEITAAPVTISAISELQQPVIQQQGNMLICQGHYSTYQWYLYGQLLTGQTRDTLFGHTTGTYTVQVTDNNGCSAQSGPYNITGLNNLTNSSFITIYPNPASTQLFIKTENIQPQTISIYDVDGRMIITQAFKPAIDINRLSPGIYFIEITAGAEVARKRFVKM